MLRFVSGRRFSRAENASGIQDFSPCPEVISGIPAADLSSPIWQVRPYSSRRWQSWSVTNAGAGFAQRIFHLSMQPVFSRRLPFSFLNQKASRHWNSIRRLPLALLPPPPETRAVDSSK